MLKKLLLSIKTPALTKALLSLRFRGYMHDMGWTNAFLSKESIGKNGEPIPWLTYPSIKFIEERLKKSMDLFEFGSGNSTVFYASKVNSVIAVENNKEWFNKIKALLPKNAALIYSEVNINGRYSNAAGQIEKKFDVIIVDGRDRVNCIKNSLKSLKENGIIILDNSDREEYKDGYAFLAKNQFRHIDFWGIAPGFIHTTCTTIFYRTENCFNI